MHTLRWNLLTLFATKMQKDLRYLPHSSEILSGHHKNTVVRADLVVENTQIDVIWLSIKHPET